MFSEIKLKNIGVFEEFTWDKPAPINVIIGENNTGKSYLLRLLYSISKSIEEYSGRKKADNPEWRDVISNKLLWVFQPGLKGRWELGGLVRKGSKSSGEIGVKVDLSRYYLQINRQATKRISAASQQAKCNDSIRSIFIPPKEVLTFLGAIGATRETMSIPDFDDTYYDLIKFLRVNTVDNKAPAYLKDVLDSLTSLFEGEIRYEKDEYVYKIKNARYSMSQVAEGVKKISELDLLIRNRIIQDNTLLYFDEPEVNLHPAAIKKLMEVLFALSKNGVSIFMATHDYFVIKTLELLARENDTEIQICSLLREKDIITYSIYDLRGGIPDNPILDVSMELYNKDLEIGMKK